MQSIMICNRDDIYNLIDGKQRLTTIFNFIDERKTFKDNKPYIEKRKIYYNDNGVDYFLDESMKYKFMDSTFPVVVIKNIEQSSNFDSIQYYKL